MKVIKKATNELSQIFYIIQNGEDIYNLYTTREFNCYKINKFKKVFPSEIIYDYDAIKNVNFNTLTDVKNCVANLVA